MPTDTLIKFGLSEKEASVYIALLELEVAVVQEIASAAGINRSSTYVVLEALQKRGLVNTNAGRGIKKYVVAPPEKLARLAEQAAKQHVDLQKEIESILPELRSHYSGTKKKPRIQIFEGKENVVRHIEHSLHVREKLIRVYSAGGHMYELFPDYMPLYMKKRTAAGIKLLGIHPDDPANDMLRKFAPKMDESVFIPPEKYNFAADLAIYDDTANFVSHQGIYSIQIRSKEITDAMKSAFDLAFEGAKMLMKTKKARARKK